MLVIAVKERGCHMCGTGTHNKNEKAQVDQTWAPTDAWESIPVVGSDARFLDVDPVDLDVLVIHSLESDCCHRAAVFE